MRIDLYPAKFFESAFWSSAQWWDMVSFLYSHTLHDSYLDGIFQGSDLATTVLIQWDLYWNQTIPPEHRFLAIRFQRTYFCHWVSGSLTLNCLTGATSELLSEDQKILLLEDSQFDLRNYQGRDDQVPHPAYEQDLVRTHFDAFNCDVEILHSKAVAFSVADEVGDICSLPLS